MYLVYKICFPNNKYYVGMTTNISRRIYQHRSGARKKYNTKLYSQMFMFKPEEIKYEIICENLTKQQAIEKESYWIEKLDSINNGYNVSPGNSVPFIGFADSIKLKHATDEEYKKKCVKALKSNEEKRIASLKSKKFRESITGPGNNMFGKVPHNAKKILCHQNGKIYESSVHAAKELNLLPRLVRRVAFGERNHTMGYTFEKVGN